MKSPERQRIVVGTNSLVSTTQPAYSNHCQMWFRLGRMYPEIDFIYVNPPRMSIDRMRNFCATTAMEHQASHILFIDDDVIIPYPFDFLAKLLACKAPLAAADVIIRGWPFLHMFFKYTKDKRGLNSVKHVKAPLGPIEVDAVGFSCCLIDVGYLKQLEAPYFVTGLTNTEDIYYCLKLRDKFPESRIVVDTSIQCGHILSAEIIEPQNLKNYREYFKKQFKPQIDDNIDAKFRGLPYYQIVKNMMMQEEGSDE